MRLLAKTGMAREVKRCPPRTSWILNLTFLQSTMCKLFFLFFVQLFRYYWDLICYIYCFVRFYSELSEWLTILIKGCTAGLPQKCTSLETSTYCIDILFVVTVLIPISLILVFNKILHLAIQYVQRSSKVWKLKVFSSFVAEYILKIYPIWNPSLYNVCYCGAWLMHLQQQLAHRLAST